MRTTQALAYITLSTVPLLAEETVQELAPLSVTPTLSEEEMSVADLWADDGSARLSHHEIEQWNSIDAAEILRQMPNVQVVTPDVSASVAQVAFRDQSPQVNGRSQIFVDGVPISNPMAVGNRGAPRLNLIQPELIESVTVHYGAFEAWQGGNSIGGSAYYTMKQPDERSGFVKVDYFVESFDLYNTDDTAEGYQSVASFSDRIGKWGVTISASHLDKEGPARNFFNTTNLNPPGPPPTVVDGARKNTSPEGDERIIYGSEGNPRIEQNSLELRVSYDITDTLTASFMGVYWTQEITVDDIDSYLVDANGNTVWSRPRYSFDGDTFRTRPDAFGERILEQDELLTGLSLSGEIADDWHFTATASYYTELEGEDRRSTYNPADPLYQNNPGGTVAESDDTYWADTNLMAHKDTFLDNDALSLDIGYDLLMAEFNSATYNTSEWKPANKTDLRDEQGGKTHLYAGFAQLGYKLAPEWKISLGLRAEQWETRDGYIAVRNLRGEYDTRTEEKLSPKLKLEYMPSDTQTLSLKFAQAHRFPLAEELFQINFNTNNELVVSNPDLNEESADQLEVSYLERFDRGDVKFTYFYYDTDDAIVRVPRNSSNNAPGPPVTGYDNIDRTTTHGLEFSTSRRDFLINKLTAQFSISYMDATIEDYSADPSSEGNDVPYVPEWRSRLQFSYRVNKQLSCSAAVRYQSFSYRRIDNADDANKDTLGSNSESLITDLSARYTINDDWILSARINNVFDETTYQNQPQSQRSFQFGAEYRF